MAWLEAYDSAPPCCSITGALILPEYAGITGLAKRLWKALKENYVLFECIAPVRVMSVFSLPNSVVHCHLSSYHDCGLSKETVLE